MDKQEYNGWTNRATWMVKLWMDNDEGLYSYARELAAEAHKREREPYAFGEQIEEWWTEFVHELTTSPKRNDTQEALLNDMLSVGLEGVEWQEIASSLLEDAAEAA